MVSKTGNGFADSHYLLFDIDGETLREYHEAFDYVDMIPPTGCGDIFKYASPHGFHIIKFTALPFNEAASALIKCPHIDMKYVGNGVKRLYWYLETYTPIGCDFIEKYAPRFMVIERFVSKEAS